MNLPDYTMHTTTIDPSFFGQKEIDLSRLNQTHIDEMVNKGIMSPTGEVLDQEAFHLYIYVVCTNI